MKLNSIVWTSTGSIIISLLSLVGCDTKGNINMQSESAINCQKWDAFANKIGIPNCDQAAPATNITALKKNLISPP